MPSAFRPRRRVDPRDPKHAQSWHDTPAARGHRRSAAEGRPIDYRLSCHAYVRDRACVASVRRHHSSGVNYESINTCGRPAPSAGLSVSVSVAGLSAYATVGPPSLARNQRYCTRRAEGVGRKMVPSHASSRLHTSVADGAIAARMLTPDLVVTKMEAGSVASTQTDWYS